MCRADNGSRTTVFVKSSHFYYPVLPLLFIRRKSEINELTNYLILYYLTNSVTEANMFVNYKLTTTDMCMDICMSYSTKVIRLFLLKDNE